MIRLLHAVDAEYDYYLAVRDTTTRSMLADLEIEHSKVGAKQSVLYVSISTFLTDTSFNLCTSQELGNMNHLIWVKERRSTGASARPSIPFTKKWLDAFATDLAFAAYEDFYLGYTG